MKKSSLIIVFAIMASFVSTISQAQKLKITDSTNVWNEKGADQSAGLDFTNKLYYKGDTIINGTFYRRMFDHYCQRTMGFPSTNYPWSCWDEFLGYMREDTAGKVYFGQNTSGGFSERLLCDYNWQVGDSMKAKDDFKLTVAAIDSVTINNISHKVWALDYYDTVHHQSSNEQFFVIEGIGSTYGFFHTLDGRPDFERSSVLICYRNNGGNPHLSKTIGLGFDNNQSCILGVNDVKATSDKAAVIPNPANSEGYIQLPHQMQQGTVTIYNSMGQAIVNEPLHNTEHWFLQGKIAAPGIYFYTISSGDAQYKGRFVFE